ncbi:MAG: uracil-DNA glycosylase [Epsilonproteobacteria bacterium]|nr:uracil-DNA glycosylase [Campylobacterota bacterium]NPA89067.1 uracil-DNA glycosylase [Campylobacterota bacterium]
MEEREKLKKLYALYWGEMVGEKYFSPQLKNPREEELEKLKKEVERCTKCPLHLTRTRPVFGEGSIDAKLFFVGEGPGAMEDKSGRPFVGRSGKLLTQLLSEVGLDRGEVYIGNIVKCRPPQNRVPTPEEAEKCKPYLLKQIDIINPSVIVCLGKTAFYYLLGKKMPISRARGQIFRVKERKVVPTFHPSYLLRNPEALPLARQDFQLIKSLV